MKTKQFHIQRHQILGKLFEKTKPAPVAASQHIGVRYSKFTFSYDALDLPRDCGGRNVRFRTKPITAFGQPCHLERRGIGTIMEIGQIKLPGDLQSHSAQTQLFERLGEKTLCRRMIGAAGRSSVEAN